MVKLRNYYYPWELGQAVEAFVEDYNHERCHEAQGNLTPADFYFGRNKEVLIRREIIKRETLKAKKAFNLHLVQVKSRKGSKSIFQQISPFVPFTLTTYNLTSLHISNPHH